MPDGEGWRYTLNSGTHVGKVGNVEDPSETTDIEYFHRRIDNGFNWNGKTSMPTCNSDYQPEYWNLIAPRVVTPYRQNSGFNTHVKVIKYFGMQELKWYEHLRVYNAHEKPEYFCTSNPPQMYWALNVEGLNEVHMLQTYYRLNFGCELEFCYPTNVLPGTTKVRPGMNRSFIFQRVTPWGYDPAAGGYDKLDPQYYIWGKNDYSKGKVDHPTPQLAKWPPTAPAAAQDAVFDSAMERTQKRLPGYDYTGDSVSVEPGVPAVSEDEDMVSPQKRYRPENLSRVLDDTDPFNEDEYIRQMMGLEDK